MPSTDAPRWMFCCDPGLLSGVAVLSWSPEGGIQVVTSLECSLPLVGRAVSQFLGNHNAYDAEVVVERFVITTKTAELGSPDWSLKVCGVIEWEIYRHWRVDGEQTVQYQQAADAKNLVPNSVLRRAELWHRGGKGHALDAIRHGVYRYAVGHRIVDAWDSIR
jgi:hypothetical protein